MLNTTGPEIRTGFFADDSKQINVVKYETIVLTANYTFKRDSQKLAFSYPLIKTSVEAGHRILVDNGSHILTFLLT